MVVSFHFEISVSTPGPGCSVLNGVGARQYFENWISTPGCSVLNGVGPRQNFENSAKIQRKSKISIQYFTNFQFYWARVQNIA